MASSLGQQPRARAGLLVSMQPGLLGSADNRRLVIAQFGKWANLVTNNEPNGNPEIDGEKEVGCKAIWNGYEAGLR